MANLVTFPVAANPGSIEIAVDFYDDNEKASLQNSELANDFSDIPKTVAIPTQDLCAYYLYYKIRPGVAGFRNHTDIAVKWYQALAEFDGQVDFGDKSIYALSLDNNGVGTTERLGEAIGLSVASELHKLHQGDWARIPKAQTKTMDFRRNIASNSVNFIELETKGSIVGEIAKKSPAVSNHKAEIKAKKAALRAKVNRTTVMYGTIAVLDDQPASVAKCWLVDPPAANIEDPRQLKILARLEYITDLISLIGLRSNLAATLQTRLSALLALPDILPLDGVPLLRGSGETYYYEPYSTFSGHNLWFASKTVVSDGPVGGQIDLVSPDLLFFIGIREELVDLAVRQDFDDIAAYSFPSATLEKTLQCTISRGRFQTQFAPYLNIPNYDFQRERGYVRFSLPAILYYTSSGLVFGTVNVPEEWKK